MMMMAPGSDGSETSDDIEKKLFTPDQEKDLREFGAKTTVAWMEKKDERPFFAMLVGNITNLMDAVKVDLGADAPREKATA